MSSYYGDIRAGRTVRWLWSTNAASGASITRATNGTISVYKDGSTTQSTTGVTDTEDYDSLTGVHYVAIDTSADGTFYSAGSDFFVVLSGATIDGQSVNVALFSFSIENRSALMPTVSGRTLDVTATGGAGIDLANVENATSTLNLSGTTIAAVSGAVGSVTNTVNAAVTSMGADTVTASALAADAVAEIQSGLATASALDAVDNFIDTEVAAIKTVTDRLDGMLELDGSVYRYTVNALEQAPSGGGGASDQWETDIVEGGSYTGNDAGALLLAIKAKTDLINTGSITVVSPYDAATQALTLVRGMDYPGTAAYNTITLTHAISGLDISTGSPTLTFAVREQRKPDGSAPLFSVTTVTATSATAAKVTLTTAQTILLFSETRYKYDLVHTLAGVDTQLVRGELVVGTSVAATS